MQTPPISQTTQTTQVAARTEPSSTPPRADVGPYDEDDRCRACGEHIAEAHQPGCPTERASEEAEHAELAASADKQMVSEAGPNAGPTS